MSVASPHVAPGSVVGDPEAVAARRLRGRDEWRLGYPLVLVSMLGVAFSTIHLYSMGVFIGPIEAEQGWSRAQISSGLFVISVLSVMGAPFIGYIIDRYGPRGVGMLGAVWYCAAITLLSTTGSSIWNWWLLWIPVAIGSLLLKPTVWVSAISSRFDIQRGLALAIVLTGASVCAGVAPPLANALIGSFGWRSAYVMLALAGGAVVIPLMFFYFRRAPVVASAAGVAKPGLAGLSIRSGIVSTRFLRLAAASLLVTMAVVGLSIHFVPMVTSLGFDRAAATRVAAMIGVGSVIGRLGTGFLLDRFNGPLVGVFSFSLPILAGVQLLMFDGSVLMALSSAFLIGLAAGSEIDVVAYLSTRFFGLKNYGTLFGTQAGIISLGGGSGATIAGWCFDYFGSYQAFVAFAMIALVISALCVGTLGRYPTSFEAPACRP